MESEEEERISKTGDAVEEGEEIYHDAVEEEENKEENLKEEEKEEKTETRKRKEKERGNTNKIDKTNVKGNKRNPVWLRLVKKCTCKRREREENQSSWANLEDLRSRTEWDKGLTE